jgi:Bacterial regulatory proteins, gntR family
MSPGKVMERSYMLLKAAMASGELRPGDRLDPAKLARAYDISPTPVRDALYRLAGERLVDSRAHDGFEVPMPGETELRSQYNWSLDLLKLALKHPKKSKPSHPEASIEHDDPAVGAFTLFEVIARLAVNPELTTAIITIGERLQPVRRIEYMVFDDLNEELALLFERIVAGQIQPAIQAVSQYHKRRIGRVTELVTCLRCT